MSVAFPALAGPLREAYRYRDLFWSLVWRELKARYKGSALGFLWSVLNPLLMLAVYNMVFSHVLRLGMKHFAVFLFCALLPWTWFTNSVSHAATCILANAGLVKKVYFPLELLPTIMVVSNLVNYLLSLPVLFAFLWYFQITPGVTLLALPVLMAITFAMAWGLGLLMATLTVFFRDVEQLLVVGFTAWFYLTPILYPFSLVPERFTTLVKLNPMAPLAQGFQRIFLENAWPDWRWLAYSAGVALVCCVLGLWAFRKHKYTFHEVV